MQRDKLYYTFNDPAWNKDPERYINLMLEQSSRNKSCWYSNVPKILGGVRNFVFKKHRDIMNGVPPHKTKNRSGSARLCPAIHSVLDNSILIKCPSDLAISITSNKEFFYTTPDPLGSNSPLIAIRSHGYSDMENVESPKLFEGYMNIKFVFPIHIGNNSDTPLIFLHPNFHTRSEFTVLNGVIPRGYVKYQELNINTLVKVPEKGEPPTEIFIKKGEVLAYLWSPKQLSLTPSRKEGLLPLFTKFTGAIEYGNDSNS